MGGYIEKEYVSPTSLRRLGTSKSFPNYLKSTMPSRREGNRTHYSYPLMSFCNTWQFTKLLKPWLSLLKLSLRLGKSCTSPAGAICCLKRIASCLRWRMGIYLKNRILLMQMGMKVISLWTTLLSIEWVEAGTLLHKNTICDTCFMMKHIRCIGEVIWAEYHWVNDKNPIFESWWIVLVGMVL